MGLVEYYMMHLDTDLIMQRRYAKKKYYDLQMIELSLFLLLLLDQIVLR